MIKVRSTTFAIVLTLGAFGATQALAADQQWAPGNQPKAGVAPTAADGNLGMAIVAARVSSSGTLLNGSGATGIIKLGTGTYEVDFNRNVAGCFYNAASFTNTVPTTVQPRSGNVNGVFIVFRTLGTTSADPVAADSEFYMTVYCGQ